MTDPLTLSFLSASALTEGIKFLYAQATELLKRRYERSNKAAEEEALQPGAPPLEGWLEPLRADVIVLAELKPDLRELRRLLADYVDGISPTDPGDSALLERMDALRRILEAIYGQNITFRGEQRPVSGPVVEGVINVRAVAGHAAAVRANAITGSSTVRGEAYADEVQTGGEIIGVDIDRIGDHDQ